MSRHKNLKSIIDDSYYDDDYYNDYDQEYGQEALGSDEEEKKKVVKTKKKAKKCIKGQITNIIQNLSLMRI